jgi:SAM-dependent methyltransferase/FKBP-type peptidyl-prolyl cis-trans isomerase 2
MNVEQRKIDSDSTVDMIFHLKWRSEAALHTDGYQASRINIWRDYIPPFLLEQMKGKQSGEKIEVRINSDEFLPKFDELDLFSIKNHQFDRRTIENQAPPAIGRFYPRGFLKDVAGVYKENRQPFRCVHLNNGHISVDFNHPLAGKELTLSGIIGKVERKESERGGSSTDWMGVLTDGPGMQGRWQSQQTDFFTSDAFGRDNETPDSHFYRQPRLVQHIDDTAIEVIRSTYGRFLSDNMDVLDLMSSWQSHLPENLTFARLVGLGLNDSELEKNSRLNEHIIQDLNQDPVLPFESASFDAVVCTVSIEYLTSPLAVFKEVARVLRPEGYFIITFSNRWFPAKAINVWKELHEFERMGMVLEYFLRSDEFTSLQTYSFRGLPRPHDDKYFPDLIYSDPVYAVWGQKG